MYVRLLEKLDENSRVAATTFGIDQSTMQVMKAGVFLHLYNLVESTVEQALSEVTQDIVAQKISFRELTPPWQSAVATSIGRLNDSLAIEQRTAAVVALCQLISSGEPLQGGKANFSLGAMDDGRIEDLAERYGVPLKFSKRLWSAVKNRGVNNLSMLGLIRVRRNDLAHGKSSFAEVGKNYTTPELRRLLLVTYAYLRQVTIAFEQYVATTAYRAAPATAPPPSGP